MQIPFVYIYTTRSICFRDATCGENGPCCVNDVVAPSLVRITLIALFKHVEKRMRSYLSGFRKNITLIIMSSSSYLAHVISFRRILLKYHFL